MTGQPPFRGTTRDELIAEHRSASVPLEPVPEPLRPIVAAGLAKDPSQRPADAATLAGQLRALADAAYGADWAGRGRSHLGEAAVLLAALWPTGGAPSVHGFTAEQVQLSRGHQAPGNQHVAGQHVPQGGQHNLHQWHVLHREHAAHLRHLRWLFTATAVVAACAVAAAAGTLVATSHPASGAGQTPVSAPRQVVPVALDGIRPGNYPVNRVISDSSPWLLTLTSIQVLANGEAKFMIGYANTSSTQQPLTCSGSEAQQHAMLTFSDGQSETAVADYCSQHGNPANFYVSAGQALPSYVIFPDASKLGQPFTLHWPAGGLSGDVGNLQLPSSS